MMITLSRRSLNDMLGDSPSEMSYAAVGYEHVKDRPHTLWLGILLDMRRQCIRAGYEEPPTPARLLELCDRYATVRRRNHAAWLR